MEERVITCINCPVGCRVTVKLENGVPVSVTGHTCPRGEKYARQEVVQPMRMVTAVVPLSGTGLPLSVKTRTPIPKASIAACMEALSKVEVKAPVQAGQVVLSDVCGTGVDVIATRGASA